MEDEFKAQVAAQDAEQDRLDIYLELLLLGVGGVLFWLR